MNSLKRAMRSRSCAKILEILSCLLLSLKQKPQPGSSLGCSQVMCLLFPSMLKGVSETSWNPYSLFDRWRLAFRLAISALAGQMWAALWLFFTFTDCLQGQGKKLYDDYIEREPGALQALQEYLNASAYRTRPSPEGVRGRTSSLSATSHTSDNSLTWAHSHDSSNVIKCAKLPLEITKIFSF
jgi:hypothetical protein